MFLGILNRIAVKFKTDEFEVIFTVFTSEDFRLRYREFHFKQLKNNSHILMVSK